MKRSQGFNPAALIECLVLAAFSVLLFYLLLSGLYLRYLTRGSYYWIFFAALVLFLLGLQRLSSIFRPSYRPPYAQFLLFLLPLFFFIMPLPDFRSAGFTGKLNSSVMGQGGLPGPGPAGNGTAAIPPAEGFAAGSGSAPAQSSPFSFKSPEQQRQDRSVEEWKERHKGGVDVGYTYGGTPVGTLPEDKVIKMTAENFAGWISEFYHKPDTYKDCELDLLGYILVLPAEGQTAPAQIKPGDSSTVFAVARLCMVCCAADMANIGVFAANDTGAELKVGQYYICKGTLSVTERDGKASVFLHIKSAEEAPVPEPEYVLPITPSWSMNQ